MREITRLNNSEVALDDKKHDDVIFRSDMTTFAEGKNQRGNR